MKNSFFKLMITVPFLIIINACNRSSEKNVSDNNNQRFYAQIANEYVVQFSAVYRTEMTSLDEVAKLADWQKQNLEKYQVAETVAYLFGPATNREIGGAKRDQLIQINWSGAYVGADGQVEIPYTYSGSWILHQNYKANFQLPIPYNENIVYSTNWKLCTDSAPEHQTQSFYWYFWDPTRSGCDHIEGVHYQMTTLKISKQTIPTEATYPQYDDLLKSNGINRNLQMTMAFGYVEDPADFQPFTDSDFGIREFQKSVKKTRASLKKYKATETPILQGEYLNAPNPDLQIGVRFQGMKDGVNFTVNVVATAGIDQMEIFAKSFAHDHDGIFGWFGHSRVGSGFDANNFGQMVKNNPSYYSISDQYQLIYWGGCNSYSYYSLPFFKFKAAKDPQNDPNGTKKLDILGNGLPSLFAFNAFNAEVTINTFMNWETRTSYQEIVNTLENNATSYGATVLVNILGDEDNQ